MGENGADGDVRASEGRGDRRLWETVQRGASCFVPYTEY